MSRIVNALAAGGVARELGQSILLLAIAGSSVGALLAMALVATRAMERV